MADTNIASTSPAAIWQQLGYFTNDGDPSVPTVDPSSAASCPVCNEPMGQLGPETTKCRSFMVCNERSYFFYYHAGCATPEGMAAVQAFEDEAVDEAFRHADAGRAAIQ